MRSLAYAALWIFVFSVPWENVVVIPGLGAFSRLTGMLAIGISLLAVAVSGRLRRWHLFHVAALLFVIWAGCSVYILSMPTIPKKFWTYAQLLLVLWMVWELAPGRQRLFGLLAAYVLGAYVSAFGTIMLYRRSAGALRRFAAGGVDANELAMTLALALPMAWYLMMTHRRPLSRWAFRGYLPVGLMALGLTGSRGGLVAGMVGLLIVPLTMTNLTPARLTTVIGVLGISGALAVAYVPKTIVERLSTTTTEVQEGTLSGRMRIWRAGVKAFAQRPVMGYGTGAFRSATSPYLGGVERVAHNSYLSVLVEQGMVGFLFYAMMFVTVFLAVLHLPQLDRRFALVLFATLGVAMLPLTWEDRKQVWFILAALFGLSYGQIAGPQGPVPQSRPQGTASVARPPRTLRPRQPVAAPVRNADPDATA